MAKKEKWPVVSMVGPCTLNKPTCVHADTCKLRRKENGEHPLNRTFEPKMTTRIDYQGGLDILHVWCGSFKEG
jgi:hypothetical protein